MAGALAALFNSEVRGKDFACLEDEHTELLLLKQLTDHQGRQLRRSRVKNALRMGQAEDVRQK